MMLDRLFESRQYEWAAGYTGAKGYFLDQGPVGDRVKRLKAYQSHRVCRSLWIDVRFEDNITQAVGIGDMVFVVYLARAFQPREVDSSNPAAVSYMVLESNCQDW